jgi:hypothetical protein
LARAFIRPASATAYPVSLATRPQAGAVGSHSLDHPQHIEITTGAASDPRDGSLESCDGGRKLRFVDDLAGRAAQDGDGVVAGVRIDADDEWVSMRDDCHGDRRSSLQ